MAEQIKNNVNNDIGKNFGNSFKNFSYNMSLEKVINDKTGNEISQSASSIGVNFNLVIFKQAFNEGRESDKEAIELVYEAFETEINNGNKEAARMMNALIKIKKNNPDFVIRADVEELGRSNSYFVIEDCEDYGLKGVHFDSDVLNGKQYSVVFHELSHLIHNLNTGNDLGNVISHLSDANTLLLQDNLTKFSNITSLLKSFYDISEERFFSEKGMDRENYKKEIIEKFNKAQNSNFFLLEKIFMLNSTDEEVSVKASNFVLEMLGLDKDIYNEIIQSDITAEEFAEKYIKDELSLYASSRARNMGFSAVLDICDAVSYGSLRSSGKYFMFGHGQPSFGTTIEGTNIIVVEDYQYECIVSELVANYAELKVSGNERAIEELRSIVGEELINEVDAIYQQMMG